MFDGKTVFVGKESNKKEKCTGCDAECILWSHIDNWKAGFVVATPYILNNIGVSEYIGQDGKRYYPQVGIPGDKIRDEKDLEKIHDKVLENARKCVIELCPLYKAH
ncbi:MAG: hypothetical protein J6J82_03020 [Alphaproteobacteria bacterium]|nr:hypothetical protein [Alphaproteobacteria bacterium]